MRNTRPPDNINRPTRTGKHDNHRQRSRADATQGRRITDTHHAHPYRIEHLHPYATSPCPHQATPQPRAEDTEHQEDPARLSGGQHTS